MPGEARGFPNFTLGGLRAACEKSVLLQSFSLLPINSWSTMEALFTMGFQDSLSLRRVIGLPKMKLAESAACLPAPRVLLPVSRHFFPLPLALPGLLATFVSDPSLRSGSDCGRGWHSPKVMLPYVIWPHISIFQLP